MELIANISPEVRAILRLLRGVIQQNGANEVDEEFSWDEVNWDEVYTIAKTQSIIPLIYRAIRNEEKERVPASFRGAVKKAFHRNGLLVQLQKNALTHVWDAFKSTSIPVLFLKGPVLGGMAYGSPIWRKPGDIDMLIHSEDYNKARAILLDAGYKLDKPPDIEKKLRLSGSEMVFSRDGFEVDLHWSLEQSAFNRFPFSPGLDEEEIWERSTTHLMEDNPVPTLSIEDTLFFLCAHGGKHAWTYLYMICDIAMLISSNVELDWRRVVGLAEKLNTERVTYLGLYLAHTLFKVELPRSVLAAIKRHPNMITLGKKVSDYLFRSASPVSALQFHRIRAGLLLRGHERALYGLCLFNRKARKISGSLIGG